MIHCRHPADKKNLDWLDNINTYGEEDVWYTRYMQHWINGDPDYATLDDLGGSPHYELLELDKEYVKGLEHEYNAHPGFWQEIRHVMPDDREQALQRLVIQPKLRTKSGRSALAGHAVIGQRRWQNTPTGFDHS